MNNLIPVYKVSCPIDAHGKVQAAGIGVIELMEKIESLASSDERR